VDIEETGPDVYESTPLRQASFWGHLSIVRLLIISRADVSAQDNRGKAPLHVAGGEAVARVLLEHGADLSVKTTHHWTPLHYASAVGDDMLVRLLLDKGADVESKNSSGQTPEDLANACSHLQIAELLRAEATRLAKCVAFAMGDHQRLGAGSWVQWLDPGVVLMVLEQV
jgi:ankyrin repeat protein